MRFSILSDADDETGLHEVVYEINRPPMDDFFTNRFYDDSGVEMAIILMCRDPQWNFNQRIRFVKKENCLYMDIMFDWALMVRSDHTARKQIVAEKIVTEVPEIVAKRKFKDFDLPRFTKDLREWFEIHCWIDPAFPAFIE